MSEKIVVENSGVVQPGAETAGAEAHERTHGSFRATAPTRLPPCVRRVWCRHLVSAHACSRPCLYVRHESPVPVPPPLSNKRRASLAGLKTSPTLYSTSRLLHLTTCRRRRHLPSSRAARPSPSTGAKGWCRTWASRTSTSSTRTTTHSAARRLRGERASSVSSHYLAMQIGRRAS